MFCPVCRCEFRSGFTYCESCDADLVESLEPVREEPVRVGTHGASCSSSSSMVDYCGFLTLEDARDAREQLAGKSIPSEIVIRDPVGVPPEERAGEEYWLRVPLKQFPAVTAILGYDTEEQGGSWSES